VEANEEQRQEERMVTQTEHLLFINMPLNLMGSLVVRKRGLLGMVLGEEVAEDRRNRDCIAGSLHMLPLHMLPTLTLCLNRIHTFPCGFIIYICTCIHAFAREPCRFSDLRTSQSGQSFPCSLVCTLTYFGILTCFLG
jgi:hypothetical protein